MTTYRAFVMVGAALYVLLILGLCLLAVDVIPDNDPDWDTPPSSGCRPCPSRHPQRDGRGRPDCDQKKEWS